MNGGRFSVVFPPWDWGLTTQTTFHSPRSDIHSRHSHERKAALIYSCWVKLRQDGNKRPTVPKAKHHFFLSLAGIQSLLLHIKLTGLSLITAIIEFLFKDDLRHHSVVLHLGISLEQQNRSKDINDSTIITIALLPLHKFQALTNENFWQFG